MTGVPYRSSGISRSSVASDTRTQPALALRPIDDGLLVPWIASWFPPVQPAGSRGWMPLMPNANVPYEPPEKGTRSVTKYSPTGVGVLDAPVAPGARNRTLPNFLTVTEC